MDDQTNTPVPPVSDNVVPEPVLSQSIDPLDISSLPSFDTSSAENQTMPISEDLPMPAFKPESGLVEEPSPLFISGTEPSVTIASPTLATPDLTADDLLIPDMPDLASPAMTPSFMPADNTANFPVGGGPISVEPVGGIIPDITTTPNLPESPTIMPTAL